MGLRAGIFNKGTVKGYAFAGTKIDKVSPQDLINKDFSYIVEFDTPFMFGYAAGLITADHRGWCCKPQSIKKHVEQGRK
jgi:hypothetical protein